MDRRILLGCLAVLGALLQLTIGAGARQKPAGGEMYVILTARLYEVDEAAHAKLAKARWLSKADLEELEKRQDKPPDLFTLLEKQKPFFAGKDVNVYPDKDGALLTAVKRIKFLPTPAQLRQGQKAPQTADEGVTLSAHVQIPPDRRFVRAKLVEKSLEVEGTDKLKVVVDDKGTEADAEIVATKEASSSQTRYVPDGASILLPLQYRSADAKKNERRWVAVITARIYIEEEERERRGQ